MRKTITSAAVVAVTALASGAVAGPATATVPQTQQSEFAALRHAPTPEVPAGVKQFLGARVHQGLGLEASQTRRLTAPDGGSWDVTPGNGVICLFVESEQAGTCTSTVDALAGRLNIQFVEPSTDLKSDYVPTNTARFLAGVLPDGAVSTTATERLGAAAVAAKPNADGLYKLSSAGLIGTVTLHRAAKRSLKITPAFNAPKKKATANASWVYFDGIPSGYRYGYAFYGGLYGSRATITNIDIHSEDGNTICGNARNSPPGDNSWAGAFFCTNQNYSGATHAYGASPRSGYAGPGAPSASVLGGATEWYNSLA